MRMRRGQVALYLVLALVAICILVMMNVGAFLAVSARNRTMNAGDAAALAVARHQGELLNRIGQLNIDHLKAALDDDARACERIMEEQRRICFLEPLDGIGIGNRAARENGAERSDALLDVLRRHVIEIRTVYEANPELYPEPWEGAWEDYARRLELALGEGIWAGPDNIDFIDACQGHYLLLPMFYHAVAGRNWCWFHFNASGLLAGYSDFGDWGPLPGADIATRLRRAANSEVYSLNLESRACSALQLLGTNAIERLAGVSLGAIESSNLITNTAQSWFLYDASVWRKWREIDPEGGFPAVGAVKPEYDVRGCAAICRVMQELPNLVDSGEARVSKWSAAAKPFGAVENAAGELESVVAFGRFVTPAFTAAHLVPLDAVGGDDLSTADPDWMHHVREHLPNYLAQGVARGSSCYYCAQLKEWDRESLRAEARRYLKYNAGSCRRGDGPGGERGGAAHGH